MIDLKKGLMPTIAVIAAVALVFMTSAFEKPQTSYTFLFEGDATVEEEVEDEGNWSLTSSAACSGQNKACTIVVNANQTEMIDGQRVLKSSLAISAVPGQNGALSGYVPDPQNAAILSINNKP